MGAGNVGYLDDYPHFEGFGNIISQERDTLWGQRYDLKKSKSHSVLTIHKNSCMSYIPGHQVETKIIWLNTRGGRPVIFGICGHKFLHKLDTVPEKNGIFIDTFLISM